MRFRSARLPLLLLLAILLPRAQTIVKIDVNLASATDLVKLPGITAQIAGQIIARRPYSQAADLRRAGLTDAQVKALQPLVIFTRIQQEIPQGQGGTIAGIPFPQIYSCAVAAPNSERTVNVAYKISPAPEGLLFGRAQTSGLLKPKEEAFCLPAGWFSADGTSFSSTGESKFVTFVSGLNAENRIHLKLVEIQSDRSSLDYVNWNSAVARLMIDRLETNGIQSPQIIWATGWEPNVKTLEHPYNFSPENVAHVPDDVHSVILVVPSAPKIE